MPKKGLLIAIEGTDGAGKGTQVDGLIERMGAAGRSAGRMDFPRYPTPTGQIVHAYLHDKVVPAQRVNPFEAAQLYIDDFLAAKPDIERSLAEHDVTFCNRYTESNDAHQGTKFPDRATMQAFWDWHERIQFVQNGIPRPDLVVILRVPAKVGIARVEKRGLAKDGHENEDHSTKAERNYLEIAKRPNHVLIECVVDGRELSPEEVLDRVWTVVNAFVTRYQPVPETVR